MKIYYSLLMALSFVLLPSCCYIRWTEPMYRIPDGRHFPKKPQFTVIPSRDAQLSEIDFSSVYVWKREWAYEGRMYTNYYHLRFWPTGECIEGVNTERLYRDDIEGFALWGKGWSMGFYGVAGSNILVEIYVPDSYNKLYGVVSSNEIHVTRTDLKYAAANFSHTTSVNKHFIRYPMGQLTAQPDWSPTGMLFRVKEE